MITIASDRLRIDIDEPDAKRETPRFSRAGFVRQVVLDGRHPFCGEEGVSQVGFTTGGAGLCQEFGIEGPCGFDDCLPGEDFPKVGVGLLRRPDLRRYRLFHRYACTPYAVTAEAAGDRARFIVHPMPCRGYALRMTQDLVAEGDRLVIDCRVENLGERSLVLEEYRHDFIAPGGRGAAPEQTLTFDRPLVARWPHQAMGLSEDGRVLTVVPPRPRSYERAVDLEATGPTSWTFHDPATGLVMTHTTDRPWTRFNCWVGHQSFSPEAFVTVPCRPGETVSWRRIYGFAAGPAAT